MRESHHSARHTATISPRHAPEVCQEFLVRPQLKGRRECRMPSVFTTGSPETNRHSLRDGVKQLLRGRLGVPGLLATITCGNCVPQARHQRRGARPPRLCRPQAAPFVKEAARVHRILPRVRHVRATPLSSGQDKHCLEVIWGRGQRKYFCERYLTDRQTTSVYPNMICPSYHSK